MPIVSGSLSALAMLVKFGLAYLVLSSSVYAKPAHSPEALQRLAWDQRWLDQLHYEKSSFGKWRSLVDGQGFFFSPEGKTDPLAELKATLDHVDSKKLVGKLKIIPRCAFPERYRFLDEKLKLKLKPLKCPKFDEFVRQFHGPVGISLVFSSAYPNNPASMFGHTFLRVRSRAGSDLRDQGLNFAALVPDNENNFAFIWFGVTGGYPGRWSNLPYYVKVNDYTNQESRDLWEYDLNFSEEETLRLLAHLWELETNSYFDYYFFDENCSYQILKALTAIKPLFRPSLDHNIYVIPGETIKKVAEIPGAVTSVKYRPSQYKKLMRRYEALLPNEESRFFEMIDQENPDFNSEKSRPVMDALLAYYDYLRSEKKELYLEEYQTQRKVLLNHRASLGKSTAEEKARLKPIVAENRPEWGHDPFSVGFGRGYFELNDGSDGQYSYFHWRSSFHDLLNNDRGYSPYAHIEFPKIDLALDDADGKVRLERLNGLRITSLFPINRLDQSVSWKFSISIDTNRRFDCLDCRPLTGEGGIGYAAHFFSKRNLVYSFFTARAEAYRGYEKGYFLGPGLELGLLVNPWPKYKIHLKATQDWLTEPVDLNELTIGLGQSISLDTNWEVRGTARWVESRLKNTQTSDRLDARIALTHFYR